ncbi:hypothetical protein EV426DRAFT_700418 [Tirmania nivea]|nr:hypothetical protein EV426DRAFT_700418 [Tirmania nivea]
MDGLQGALAMTKGYNRDERFKEERILRTTRDGIKGAAQNLHRRDLKASGVVPQRRGLRAPRKEGWDAVEKEIKGTAHNPRLKGVKVPGIVRGERVGEEVDVTRGTGERVEVLRITHRRGSGMRWGYSSEERVDDAAPGGTEGTGVCSLGNNPQMRELNEHAVQERANGGLNQGRRHLSIHFINASLPLNFSVAHSSAALPDYVPRLLGCVLLLRSPLCRWRSMEKGFEDAAHISFRSAAGCTAGEVLRINQGRGCRAQSSKDGVEGTRDYALEEGVNNAARERE